jgi:hypothetical protein
VPPPAVVPGSVVVPPTEPVKLVVGVITTGATAVAFSGTPALTVALPAAVVLALGDGVAAVVPRPKVPGVAGVTIAVIGGCDMVLMLLDTPPSKGVPTGESCVGELNDVPPVVRVPVPTTVPAAVVPAPPDTVGNAPPWLVNEPPTTLELPAVPPVDVPPVVVPPVLVPPVVVPPLVVCAHT